MRDGNQEVRVSWSWLRGGSPGTTANLRVEDVRSGQAILDLELSAEQVADMLSSLTLRTEAWVVPAEYATRIGATEHLEVLRKFRNDEFTSVWDGGNRTFELVPGATALGNSKAEVEAKYRLEGWEEFRWDARNDGRLHLLGFRWVHEEEDSDD